MKKIVANFITREKRYAVLEEGRLAKLEVFQPDPRRTLGNIYAGRVTKVLPGMEAAFVDYGTDKEGFLHQKDLPKDLNLHEGRKLLVQVSREENGTKGAKLSGLVELAGPSLVYTGGGDFTAVSRKFPREEQIYWRKLADEWKDEGEGLVVRTSMAGQDEEAFRSQLEQLRDVYRQLERKAAAAKKPVMLLEYDVLLNKLKEEMTASDAGQLIIDDFESSRDLARWLESRNSSWTVTYDRSPGDLFAVHGVYEDTARLLDRIVPLPGGGSLVIEETEAFTVIDVNSGGHTGTVEKEQTLLDINLEAAEEAARQIRLRNSGGIILIDFINMKEEDHRKRIARLIKKAVKQDSVPVKVIGFTELGILQLTRKRTAPSLAERLMVPCSACGGTGRVESPETLAFSLERELMEHRFSDEEAVWIEISSNVKDALFGSREELRSAVEAAAGKKIVVTECLDDACKIKRFGSLRELKEAAAGFRQ